MPCVRPYFRVFESMDMQRIEAYRYTEADIFGFQCYCHIWQLFNPVYHDFNRQMDKNDCLTLLCACVCGVNYRAVALAPTVS